MNHLIFIISKAATSTQGHQKVKQVTVAKPNQASTALARLPSLDGYM
jgi:hypothetical protein